MKKWGALCGFRIDRAEAEDLWRQYRDAVDRTGFYPLIMSGHIEEYLADDPESDPLEVTLAKARSLDAVSLLRRRADEALSMDGDTPELPDFDDADDSNPDDDAFATLQPDFGNSGAVHIVFLPTTRPWEVFAYLDYGGWNEYPYPHEHVAIMKRWHDLYGAEPVIVTGDVIEMRVASPPTDDDACRTLALEQFAYTGGDLVYQGYQKFGNLSRALRGRKHWFFWWD